MQATNASAFLVLTRPQMKVLCPNRFPRAFGEFEKRKHSVVFVLNGQRINDSDIRHTRAYHVNEVKAQLFQH